MRSEIRELRANRAKLVADVRTILDADEVTAEDEVRADAVMAEADVLKVQIDREERVLASETELRNPVTEPVVKPGEPASAEDRKVKRDAEYSAAFNSYVRRGFAGMRPEQRDLIEATYSSTDEREDRDLGVGVTTAGGFTVPQGFYDKLTEAQKWFGGVRSSRATILSTESGQDLPIPADNDTANEGVIVAENSLIDTQDLVFSQRTLHAYMYSSKIVRVSRQMLQDGAFNVEDLLSHNLGVRIARILNKHFTIGSGAGEPQGVLTGASLGKTGAAAAAAIVYEDLVDVEHSVDKAYRQNAEWMFHDQTLRALKKIKDLYGRPLWLAGIAVNAPDTILGYPYVVNNDVPESAPDAKSMLFGDFSSYFVRDVLGTQILRLEERYADYLQVGFLAFERHDGIVVDAGTHPISYYVNSPA